MKAICLLETPLSLDLAPDLARTRTPYVIVSTLIKIQVVSQFTNSELGYHAEICE